MLQDWSAQKNSAGTVLRILCDICVATLAFWAIGVAILFQQHNRFFWIEPDYLVGRTDLRGDSLFFHFAMMLTASGIVCGAVGNDLSFSRCAARRSAGRLDLSGGGTLGVVWVARATPFHRFRRSDRPARFGGGVRDGGRHHRRTAWREIQPRRFFDDDSRPQRAVRVVWGNADSRRIHSIHRRLIDDANPA